jgi:hypothetical protein
MAIGLLGLFSAVSASAQVGGWELVPTAAAPSWEMFDVKVWPAQQAYAVGRDDQRAGMVAQFDGSAWREVYTVPGATSELRSIAKTRSGTAWVVGSTGSGGDGPTHALIIHKHHGWHAVTAGHTGVANTELYGVAAVSDSNVWAVGSTSTDGYTTTRTLVEHWNGRRWRIVASPSPNAAGQNYLTSVAAARDGAVFVAGQTNQGPLLLQRNGHGWRRLRMPRLPGYDRSLTDVLARSSNRAWFVGTYQRRSDGFSRPLVLHWNGSVLLRVPVLHPSDWDSSYISTIARTSKGRIYAAGTALLEHGGWNASQAIVWRLTPGGFTPMSTPPVSGSGMSSISTGGGIVLAVGGSDSGAFTDRLAP